MRRQPCGVAGVVHSGGRGNAASNSGSVGGGGGGGGFYGGGGGALAGGGGGSSYTTIGQGTIYQDGANGGDGYMLYTFGVDPVSMFPSVLPTPFPTYTAMRPPTVTPTTRMPSITPTVAPSQMTCSSYQSSSTGGFNVACNINTAAGYYWAVGQKVGEYGTYGLQSTENYPHCNATTVGKTARPQDRCSQGRHPVVFSSQQLVQAAELCMHPRDMSLSRHRGVDVLLQQTALRSVLGHLCQNSVHH